MKVSIIGTNGFLSTAMAIYCNSQGWTLDIYGRHEPIGYKYNNFYKIDLLTDKLNYEILCQSEIIVYASGAGIQSNLNESADLIYALNVAIPVNICNELKAKGYKGIIVTFGSVFEIGETMEQRPFSEIDILTSACKAVNDYTVSKRMLTRFIDGYKHEFTHWHMFLPTIYGEKENPLRLIPYTIAAIKNKEVPCYTAGDQVRQYIYIDEIPHIIKKAYNAKLLSGLYNIGGTEILSVKEIVSMIYQEFGTKVPNGCFGTTPRKDAAMKFLALDGTKLYSTIDYHPGILIKEVIKKYTL